MRALLIGVVVVIASFTATAAAPPSVVG